MDLTYSLLLLLLLLLLVEQHKPARVLYGR
jgi:hypothetical protein